MSAFEGRILKYSLLGGGLGYVVLLLNQKLYIQFYMGLYKIWYILYIVY
jgi:hypothetical protein